MMQGQQEHDQKRTASAQTGNYSPAQNCDPGAVRTNKEVKAWMNGWMHE